MKVKGEYVLREIAGDYILVPTGKAAMEINGLISMNDIGVFIWNRIEKGEEENMILRGIMDAYEVEEQEAKADLEEFMNQLIAAGMIEKD